MTEQLELKTMVSSWRERIKSAGKSEEQAAHESGLFKSQLSQYLSGKHTPSLEKFELFENYLRGLNV